MTHFRKITAAVLAITLALCLFAGCAGASEPDEEAVMADNWEAYLSVNEQIHTAFQWAFSYAESYALENDWESLLKARAAASAALITLRQLEAPESTLTDEQYDALLAKGIEADVVLTELSAMPQFLQSKQDTLALLNYHLKQDIFLTPDAEMFADWVQSSIKIDDLDAQYVWLTTNYLLLQTKQDKLWDSWQKDFPGLAEDITQWQTTADELMVQADSLLDTMAEELVLYEGYAGTSEYALEIVKEAVATGDLTELAQNLNRMEGVPGYFPVPEWLPDVTWLYVSGESGSDDLELIRTGDVIAKAPAACYIACPDISLRDARAYCEELKRWGLEPYETEDDEGNYQMLVKQGDSQLLLKWDEAETVLYFTDPVGSLIPSLYLSALFS